MTLLSFIHEHDRVQLLTDTLATDPGGAPQQFTDKVFTYASRDMVMAGTGYAALLSAWDHKLRESVLAVDLSQIDAFASDVLNDLWNDLRQSQDLPDEATATIYHFGFERDTKEAVRIAYRSKSDFVSERTTEPGFGIKPQPSDLRLPESMDDWIKIAVDLREEQDSGPAEGRIWIGGQLIHTVLTPDEVFQRRVHEFVDYGEQWNLMNAMNDLM